MIHRVLLNLIPLFLFNCIFYHFQFYKGRNSLCEGHPSFFTFASHTQYFPTQGGLDGYVSCAVAQGPRKQMGAETATVAILKVLIVKKKGAPLFILH